MSLSYVEHARAVRARLMNPPNAVFDPENPRAAKLTIVPAHVLEIVEAAPVIVEPEQPFQFHPDSNRHLRAGHRGFPTQDIGFERCHYTMRDITVAVAFHCGFEVRHIHKQARTAPLVLARQIAMYFIYEMTDRNYTEIGRYFDRDHTTVMHAKRRVSRLIEEDIKVAELVQKIRVCF